MIGVVAQQERAGDILTYGDDLSLRLGAIQKFPTFFGPCGVIQIKNADDALFLHGDTLADVQIGHHSTSPFFT